MRAIACAAAVLMVAFTLACNDRDRQDTASRIDNAAGETGDAVREGADDTEDAVEKAGDATEEAAEDTKDAAEDAKDDVRDNSYAKRDEFRLEVQSRLDAMDRELEQLEGQLGKDAADARVKGVAAARDARQAAGKSFDRLANATEANWEAVRKEVSRALDTADRQLRALRPDANPMGGTGGTS
jgi:hypothetical protein